MSCCFQALAAGASVYFKGGNSAAFFEPAGNGVARDAKDTADAAQGGTLVVGAKDLFFVGGIVSYTTGSLYEATPAIAAAVALFALGSVAVSYGVGAGAMPRVGGLCINALYGSSTTAVDPLPEFT